MSDIKRWRGLKDLIRDATLHGSGAVERVHLETARRPFHVLKQIPPLAAPASGIERIHDAIVTTTYGAVRGVTRVVDVAADAAFDALETTGGAPESNVDATSDEQLADERGD
ncbi:MAG: hypothetical protein PVI30_16975 [Myxococcales bacterium]|jgi:hypothetical protein